MLAIVEEFIVLNKFNHDFYEVSLVYISVAKPYGRFGQKLESLQAGQKRTGQGKTGQDRAGQGRAEGQIKK